MAKKKEEAKAEYQSSQDKRLAELEAKLAEHQKSIEAFRVSFENLDAKIRTVIERNRLR